MKQREIMKITKLTVSLILFACLQVSAHTYSKDRITLRLEAAQIKKVLSAIEKKSDYRFLYNDDLLANKPKVDVNVTNEEVTKVLDNIFSGNGIAYKILENKLVVLKATADDQRIEVMDKTVTGKVTDATGQPLPGVSVAIKATKFGATTNSNGEFSIVVPDDKSVLVFSYVGYNPQEITVGSRSTINVSLQNSTNSMDQVVVIGYGTANKRDLTGSIVKVSGKEVADKPNSNPVASLLGKVAGLYIVNNASPGQEPDIRIRGTVTIG